MTNIMEIMYITDIKDVTVLLSSWHGIYVMGYVSCQCRYAQAEPMVRQRKKDYTECSQVENLSISR
jgi:hypothetical protein